jgi:anhydro-N-acetylmuramic acid kinase
LTKLFTALGLMSGTSMDGIDVALVRSDGEAVVHRGPFLGVPYDEATRARLREALEDAASLRRHTDRPGRLAEVERRLTRLHADAVSAFLVACDLNIADLDVIGFHGQTVLHRPQARLTVQLGDGAALARATGVPVVCDLRQADIAAGGQGAPLVPVYHQALAAGLPERPVAFVNIGGVANVTLVGAGVPIAFDCGPGNALLDDWASTATARWPPTARLTHRCWRGCSRIPSSPHHGRSRSTATHSRWTLSPGCLRRTVRRRWRSSR